MNLSEFKHWFEGFTEGMEGQPSEKQWERIRARIAEIKDAPPTIITRDAVREYWPRPWYYGSPYYYGGAIAGVAQAQSAALQQNMAQQYAAQNCAAQMAGPNSLANQVWADGTSLREQPAAATADFFRDLGRADRAAN